MTPARGPRSTAHILQGVVLDAFRGHDRMRRVDVMNATGLSRPVVTALLDNLVAQGLLVPAAQGLPARGRPSPAYRLVRTPARAAVVRLFRGPSTVTVLGDDGPRATRPVDAPWRTDWDRWITAVAQALDEAEGVCGTRADQVVVALPFPVSAGDDGLAFLRPDRISPRLAGPNSLLAGVLGHWYREHPGDHLARTLGRPVRLANDANLAALGEARHGAAAGTSVSLHLSVRDGLGAGIVIAGRLHHGALGAAGELAHVRIEEHGTYCLCGKRGCLATQLLAPDLDAAFAHLYGRPMDRGTVDAILADPDHVASRFLGDLGRLVARSLAATMTMLDPDMLVVDRELDAGHKPFAAGLATYLAPDAGPGSTGAPPIVPGTLADPHAWGALTLVAGTP
jgi:predicted NBD/HSP70 family sugar kinase